MKGVNCVLLLLIGACSYSLAQTPVPARPLGYVYQTSATPTIVIEAFYDLLCSDSKNNWPILKEIAYGVRHYVDIFCSKELLLSQGTEDVFDTYSEYDVSAIIHIFPLPYHHNAYFMQQASVVVRQTDHSQFVKFMELVFQYQEMFLSGAVNMTEPEVKAFIAGFISSHLNVDFARVIEGFSDAVVSMDARYAWKYAASRGMTGTPQFLVNGVHVPTAADFSVTEWNMLLSELLNTPTRF